MKASLGYEQEDVGFYITDDKGYVIVSCDTEPTENQLSEINRKLSQPEYVLYGYATSSGKLYASSLEALQNGEQSLVKVYVNKEDLK